VLRNPAITLLIAFFPFPALAQKTTAPDAAVKAVRQYRQENEDRIIRELREFLAIPNVASDTVNIQKNAERLQGMLEARGIETHLLSIEGRGPVVFGKLETPGAKRTVIFYGEEEAGSEHLQQTLELHKNLLAADVLLTGDGPVHQNGRPLIFFGNRGVIGVNVTVYGPVRALHSGHYGNWAPNPALELSRLLAAMKDENGRVRIPGYYDDVTPLGEAEKKALAELPNYDAELEKELGIAKPDGGGKKLAELIMEPSLNIRGFRSAYVGGQAQNVVPDRAEASLDARLVKGEDPKEKSRQIVEFIRQQGFFVTDREPTIEERRAHTKVAKVIEQGGYRASRTRMDLPVSKAIIGVMKGAEGDVVIAP